MSIMSRLHSPGTDGDGYKGKRKGERESTFKSAALQMGDSAGGERERLARAGDIFETELPLVLCQGAEESSHRGEMEALKRVSRTSSFIWPWGSLTGGGRGAGGGGEDSGVKPLQSHGSVQGWHILLWHDSLSLSFARSLSCTHTHTHTHTFTGTHTVIHSY